MKTHKTTNCGLKGTKVHMIFEGMFINGLKMSDNLEGQEPHSNT